MSMEPRQIPALTCNRYLKFDKMFQRMRELEYDYIVTGHYARVEYDEEKNRYLLKKAVDDTKDQSYVLYMLTQEQLAHISLPLGGLRKTEVRERSQRSMALLMPESMIARISVSYRTVIMQSLLNSTQEF